METNTVPESAEGVQGQSEETQKRAVPRKIRPISAGKVSLLGRTANAAVVAAVGEINDQADD
jgi:hypothetical protein